MLPFTHDLKNKISGNIKNGADISDLIKGVDLRGADLGWAIIKDIQLNGVDIRGCNFSYTKIGNDSSNCFFINCNIDNCNFYGAEFVGKVSVRSCHAHNCNFKMANLAKADYQYTDFTGSNFCDSVLRIGTREGLGCILPTTLFEELCKGWKNKIKLEKAE